MKKVKQLNKWGIYELTEKEQKAHGFKIAVIHPDVIGTGLITARDSDIELDTIEQAIEWVTNY